MLFVKTMPEQDGAPGNLFKGPIFAALMVIIGTMTLTVTFYTLAVENLNIKSAKDVREKAKELQAKAKAAAETAKGKLTGRGKKKAFGDEDDDDDGAAAQVAQAVTPHGDEDRREWGRTSDGKMGWVPPRPAPAPTRLGPVVREMPLQQEAPVDVEAPAIHKKRHHKKTVTPPADGDEEAPPPPPDDDAVPPPPPDEEDEEAMPPTEADDVADPARAPAKGDWFSSVVGTKKLVAAWQARGVEAASDGGVPEAKAVEEPTEEAKTQVKAPPKKSPPAKKSDARKPSTPAVKKRSWFPKGRAAQPKPAARPAPAPAAKTTTGVVKDQPAPAPAPAAQAARAEVGRGAAPPAPGPARDIAEAKTERGVAESKAEHGVAESKAEPTDRRDAPPAKPADKPKTAPAPAPAAKKRSWFPSRAARPAPAPAKNVVKGQSAPAPALAPAATTRPAIGRGAAPPAEEAKADDRVAIDVQYKSEGSSSEDEDRASTLERPTAPPTARPTATRAASWVGGESTTLLPAASARPTAMRAASWVGGPLVSPPSLRTPNPAAAAPPLVPRAPPAASVFTVVGRSGGRMRASVEMTSPLVGDLPRGSLVVVHERGVTSTGAARCRVVAGEAQGWLSEKVLAPADGVAAEKKARVIDAALRLLATSAAAIDWAPAETDTGDGPATTPAGSRSRASTAAHSALRAVTTSAAFRAPATFQDGPASRPPGAPGMLSPSLQPPLHCRVCLQRLPCACPTPVPAASTSSLEDGPP